MLLSGSSDTHLRLTDLTTMQGWSTFPEYNTPPSIASMSASLSLLSTTETSEPKFKCQTCGSNDVQPTSAPRAAHNRHGVLCVHTHLVRTVALGKDLAVSGSYDRTIKVCCLQYIPECVSSLSLGVGPGDGCPCCGLGGRPYWSHFLC